jgi:hypothetical protein
VGKRGTFGLGWALPVAALVALVGCSAPVAGASPAPTTNAAPVPSPSATVPLTPDAGSPPANPGPQPPTLPHKPAPDAACEGTLAWWAVGASFDANVTPAAFAEQLNPLIAQSHPITVADSVDENGSWTLRASATVTNGNQQQYFPAEHAVADGPMSRTQAGFATASPAASAWLHLVDAAAADVWIAITNVGVTAAYADGYCQTLTTVTVDAIIPDSAGSTSITTAQGAATLRDLLGGEASEPHGGWNVRLSFSGQRAEVTFK